MRAEILTIGDEILIGDTLNSNAAYIGKALSSINIDVTRHLVVGDDMPEMLTALGEAWNRSDLVLVTGGLGPTHDDITKDALCQFFQTDYEYHADIVEEIERWMEARGKKMPDRVRNQGLIPRGATRIRNSIGSAEGIRFDRDGKTLIAMPGVPLEMQRMVVDTIVPSLSGEKPAEYILMRRIKTFGLFESQLVEKFSALDSIRENVKVAILPRITGVELRFTATASSEEAVKSLITDAEAKAFNDLGDNIYGTDDQTLESRVIDELIRRNRTVSTAESCTGGLVASILTDVPGSSACFQGSVVTYSNALKISILGVSQQVIEAEGAVSKEVAEAMAKGVRLKLGTDYGLATTGIAGPGGGTSEKPVGLVHIAVAGPRGVTHNRLAYPMNRQLNKQGFACAVLNLLLRELLREE